MQEACQARLAHAGYAQYEVSAYARAGAQCRHNLNYWRFGDYLGVGAGAHGKLTRDGRIMRTARHRSPARFMAAATSAARMAEERVIETAELPFEFCLNALRLVDGFDSETFEERTGCPDPSSSPPARRRLSADSSSRPASAGRRRRWGGGS